MGISATKEVFRCLAHQPTFHTKDVGPSHRNQFCSSKTGADIFSPIKAQNLRPPGAYISYATKGAKFATQRGGKRSSQRLFGVIWSSE